MAWVTQSSTRAAGYVVTATNWNESMADLNYLKGHTGTVAIDTTGSTGVNLSVAGSLIASSSASVAGHLYLSTGMTVPGTIIGDLVMSTSGTVDGIDISAHATGTALSQHSAGLGISRVQTGSYAGNGSTEARHISVGFKCGYARLTPHSIGDGAFDIQSTGSCFMTLDGGQQLKEPDVYLSDSTGFVVSDGSTYPRGNVNAVTYYFVAFGT